LAKEWKVEAGRRSAAELQGFRWRYMDGNGRFRDIYARFFRVVVEIGVYCKANQLFRGLMLGSVTVCSDIAWLFLNYLFRNH
jgi:hypothetical protein